MKRAASFLAIVLVGWFGAACTRSSSDDPAPLVEVPGALARVTEAGLRRFSKEIAAIGPRFSGTQGELDARAYVARTFGELGLEVTEHPFGYTLWNPVAVDVTLHGPDGGPIEAELLGFTPSTPPEGLTAETVYVGNGQEDYETLTLAETIGKIHLADASDEFLSHRMLQYINAELYGAVAFVHLQKRVGERGERLVEIGSTHGLASIPGVAVDQATGDRLRANAGERMTIRSETTLRRADSVNVRGVLPGRTDEFVTVGAHLDSWYVGESAADNATGLAGMLEIARAMAEGPAPERSVHFIAFAAEELGVQGSIVYAIDNVFDIAANCKLMVNLDVAGIRGERTTVTASTDALRERALAFMERARFAAVTGTEIEIPEVPALASDLIPYAVAGVPVFYLIQVPNVYYHTRFDTIDRIDFRTLRHEVGVAAEMVIEVAEGSFTP